jgi:hypothetical protein
VIFSVVFSVSSTNKTDRHDITEILLKVALNAINLNQPSIVNKIFNIGKGPGWLNELGSWITLKLIQAYHQYGVGSRLAF